MRKQQDFFGKLNLKGSAQKTYGGETSKGKRKVKRPLDTKKPLHLVMRSSKAKGRLSLLSKENKIFIEKIFRNQAIKFGVRIGSLANVGNHVHLMLRISNRKGFQAFLKSTSAMIARFVTKACRGNPFGKFWDALAFTRVITSNKESAVLVKYIKANLVEVRQGKNARMRYLTLRSYWEQKLYSG